MSKSFVSFSVQETAHFGRMLARQLEQVSLPCVVLLKGPLGSGKTTLLKTVISELAGIASEEISSPTFQYVALYSSLKGVPLAHFDLWRLPDVEAFLSLGLDEILHSSLSFVEWPERLDGLEIPGVRLLTIEALSEQERTFKTDWDVV